MTSRGISKFEWILGAGSDERLRCLLSGWVERGHKDLIGLAAVTAELSK